MKVYISYAHADEAVAQKLAEALQRAGLEVWYARTGIFPGDNWAEEVAKALRESDAMIVLLSQQAVNSDYLRHDISYALGEQRFRNRLIPVVIGSSEKIPPEKFPAILRRLQLIELAENENENGFKKITQALAAAA